MDLLILREFFMWSFCFSMGLLLWWFLFMALASDWVYSIHSKFFTVSREQFNAIQYAAMAYYKLSVILFFLTPYLVLYLMS
ncbi:MAG: hypothetical protein HN509_13865 [Halobacteriovoraceae bacterium]|jgi:hypothetical protein|nr:hypothetical protein [Halobacteriovoraceae bacterium]MBT5094373.1 hypothetical protein [Halobacteriovoraceae bacterium]